MTSTKPLTSQDPILRAEINRRLLESGELERLEILFLDLLRESGWYENTQALCQDRLRDQDAQIHSFNALYDDVQKKCSGSVPESVKIEVVKAIKKVLEDMIE